MVKSVSLRTALITLCLVLSYNIHAEQVIRLTPTDDVYTYSNSEIRGMEPLLKTYHSTAGTQYRRITFLKFDISTVPTEVDSVVLRLYTNGWGTNGTEMHKFDLYNVLLNTWAEDDLTYSNFKEKAGADQSIIATTTFDKGISHAAGWVEWRDAKVNTYVQDSAAAAKQYLSFRIREGKVVKDAGNNAVVVEFHSKENESGFAPELIVYAPDGAKPAEREVPVVVHDSAEARLSAILLDGEPMEFFNKDSLSYVVNLPYSATTEPQISAITMDSVASFVVNDHSITCTSADRQNVKTYSVSFQVLPKMDLFLAIGQSNMSGRAPFADATESMEGVYLLTPKNGMEISSNPMNKYSNIRKDLSVQGMGPHYQFALTMRDSLPERTIGMVVNALGGSSITSWYAPGKSLYDATIKRCKEAGIWGEWKGVIWHQGESDKGSAAADDFATYKNRMKTLAENLRNDLGVDTLWFICGELSQKAEQEAFNRTVIQKVSEYIPYSDYVSSVGTALLSDNTHFDEPSVKVMGQRYAEKMLEHVYSKSTSTNIENAECRMQNIQLVMVNGQILVQKDELLISLLGQYIQ